MLTLTVSPSNTASHRASQKIFLKSEKNHSEDNSLTNLTCWLKNVVHDQAAVEIAGKAIFSAEETKQITESIINVKYFNSRTSYACQIDLECSSFLINQYTTEPNVVEICNLNTHQMVILENVPFPELQRRLLQRHIKEQGYLTLASVNLSNLDINTMNLRGIDFSFTLLSKQNLIAIIAGDGDLTGAKLLDGVDATDIQLGKVRMDKTMAIQLIKAGANSQSVLANYLDTKRVGNATNISISGINLTKVCARNLDLTDIDLRGAKFGISEPLTLHEEHLQQNFFHDLMITLKIFSQTVNSIILHSASRDLVHNAPNEIHNIHQAFLKKFIVWKDQPVISELIETVVKFSIGNCTELACIGKSLVDLYLTKVLTQLGYRDFFIRALVCYARAPSNHSVTILKCSFQGSLHKYIMDSWSDGQAWTYTDGLTYYQQLKPNAYLKPDIQFETHEEINAALEASTCRSSLFSIFKKYRVQELLVLNVGKRKSEFKGAPAGSCDKCE